MHRIPDVGNSGLPCKLCPRGRPERLPMLEQQRAHLGVRSLIASTLYRPRRRLCRTVHLQGQMNDSEGHLGRVLFTNGAHSRSTPRGYDAARLRADHSLLGPLLEGFIFSELLNLSSVSAERVSLFHFRDRDQNEVDFVLENVQGQSGGIEVKATASSLDRDEIGMLRTRSESTRRRSCHRIRAKTRFTTRRR